MWVLGWVKKRGSENLGFGNVVRWCRGWFRGVRDRH